jgi:mannose-6-phosphate isomerase-like protein (cupin superfamily)
MSEQVISAKTGDHYKWGGPSGVDCDGWHLVKTPDLSIIEELMPPGASEARHSHGAARQFFFVLDGELTLEVEGQQFLVEAGEGLEIAPGRRHQARNNGSRHLRMTVTSQPPSHGDRINA